MRGRIYRAEGSNLVLKTVRTVGISGQLAKRSDGFLLADWVNPADPMRIRFNPSNGYLSIAQGLWGVRQVQVEKE